MKEINYFAAIDDVEKLCYTGKKDEALGKLYSLIEKITCNESDNQHLVRFLDVLILKIKNNDLTLIADYLEYGLKPFLMDKGIPEYLFEDSVGCIPKVNDKIFYMFSYSDELVLCAKRNDEKIVHFNSWISPEHEADIILSSLKLKKTTPAVGLFGIGTGLLAEKILNELPSDSKFIIYEPTEELINYCLQCSEDNNCTIEERLITDRINKILNDKRVILFIHSKASQLFISVLADLLDFRDIKGLVVCINSGYQDFNSRDCCDFLHSLNDYTRLTVTNRNTLIRFENEYLELIFKNLWISREMNISRDLSKIFPSDLPVIIVAAGPSLSKNIDILKMAKGHLLLVAVDSAIRYLLDNDIVPDVNITIDPIKPADYFDERALDIPCIIDPTANNRIVEKIRGRKFVLTYNEYFNNLLRSVGKSFPVDQIGGGSVATVAFALMYNLGMKKIILVGQDLASSGGKTHAGDIHDGSVGDIQIEGIDGNMVYTRSDWYNYLKWYETYIELIKKEDPKICIIDATEGGARIHGTEIMTLREAIRNCQDSNGNLPTHYFGEEIKKLDYYLDETEYVEFRKNHRKNIFKLHEIEVEAEDVVSTCKRLIKGIEDGNISASYINKEKKRIHRIHDHYINSPMHGLINQYLEGSLVSTVSYLSLVEGNKTETEINGIKLLQVSFEAIANVAKKIHENAIRYDNLL